MDACLDRVSSTGTASCLKQFDIDVSRRASSVASCLNHFGRSAAQTRPPKERAPSLRRLTISEAAVSESMNRGMRSIDDGDPEEDTPAPATSHDMGADIEDFDDVGGGIARTPLLGTQPISRLHRLDGWPRMPAAGLRLALVDDYDARAQPNSTDQGSPNASRDDGGDAPTAKAGSVWANGEWYVMHGQPPLPPRRANLTLDGTFEHATGGRLVCDCPPVSAMGQTTTSLRRTFDVGEGGLPGRQRATGMHEHMPRHAASVPAAQPARDALERRSAVEPPAASAHAGVGAPSGDADGADTQPRDGKASWARARVKLTALNRIANATGKSLTDPVPQPHTTHVAMHMLESGLASHAQTEHHWSQVVQASRMEVRRARERVDEREREGHELGVERTADQQPQHISPLGAKLQAVMALRNGLRR